MTSETGGRLKIGVVGTGWIAGAMGLFFKWNKRVKMTAACDVKPDLLAKFARRFKVPETYADYDSLLAKADVDAVYLAIPHHLHCSFLLKTLAAGKHIICEKPLTVTMEEAKQVIARAQLERLKLGVNYQYRYAPRLYSIARAIQGGHLGKMYYAAVRCPWYRGQKYYDQGPWRLKWPSAGGGTTLIHASHSIDIMAWAMGVPVSVMGEMAALREDIPGLDVEDTAVGAVRFASGALGIILASMNSNRRERQRGPASVNFQDYVGSRGQIHYRGPVPGRVKYLGVKTFKAKPPGAGIMNYSRIVDNFAGWVLHDESFLNPAEESLKTLSIVFGLYESARTGRRVTISQ